MDSKIYYPVKGCPSCDILTGEMRTLLYRYKQDRSQRTHDLFTETKDRFKDHYRAAHEDPQVILREQYDQVARELGISAGEFLAREIMYGPWTGERGPETAGVIAALKALYKAIPKDEKHPESERFRTAANSYADWFDKFSAFDEKKEK